MPHLSRRILIPGVVVGVIVIGFTTYLLWPRQSYAERLVGKWEQMSALGGGTRKVYDFRPNGLVTTVISYKRTGEVIGEERDCNWKCLSKSRSQSDKFFAAYNGDRAQFELHVVRDYLNSAAYVSMCWFDGAFLVIRTWNGEEKYRRIE